MEYYSMGNSYNSLKGLIEFLAKDLTNLPKV